MAKAAVGNVDSANNSAQAAKARIAHLHQKDSSPTPSIPPVIPLSPSAFMHFDPRGAFLNGIWDRYPGAPSRKEWAQAGGRNADSPRSPSLACAGGRSPSTAAA